VILSRSLPKMFFSVAERCSPPVDCSFLMSSSVMSIKRDKSVEFPHKQTVKATHGQPTDVSPRSVYARHSLCVNSLNINLEVFNLSSSEIPSAKEKGAANREASSKTASADRAKVSHFCLKKTSNCEEGTSQFWRLGGQARCRRERTVFDPVLGKRETLAESSVLVSLGEHPRRVHAAETQGIFRFSHRAPRNYPPSLHSQILSSEVSSNLLVPEGDITGTVIGNVPELVVGLQRVEEILHPVDTLDEVLDTVLVVLFAR
jgi:hypothetical protein